MGYNITKEFGFCYGHRVWSQTLNAEYTLDTCAKCRHLHGHEGRIIVSISPEDDSKEKLSAGMVIDFKFLNWFKKWIDDVFDHKFIMDLNDPLLSYEVPLLFPDGTLDQRALIKDSIGHCYVINPDYLKLVSEQCIREKYEGMVLVNFVPTSENLSRFFYDLITERMAKLPINIDYVTLYETPKSSATYTSTIKEAE